MLRPHIYSLNKREFFMSFDPISDDIEFDPEFPATMMDVEFLSDGSRVNGVAYIPAGEGAFPVVLLLHGIPGHERNLDLAQILRRAGYVTVVFHYRGAWGSEGNYRLRHVLEDTRAAIQYFRENATDFRGDARRIYLIGHSLGGWSALLNATYADAVASISAVNISLWAKSLIEYPEVARPSLEELVTSFLGPLSGATTEDILEEIVDNASAWNIENQVEVLRQKQVLLVAGKRDTTTPVFDHHMPLANALKGEDSVKSILIKTDHVYSDKRITLARELLRWLADLR